MKGFALGLGVLGIVGMSMLGGCSFTSHEKDALQYEYATPQSDTSDLVTVKITKVDDKHYKVVYYESANVPGTHTFTVTGTWDDDKDSLNLDTNNPNFMNIQYNIKDKTMLAQHWRNYPLTAVTTKDQEQTIEQKKKEYEKKYKEFLNYAHSKSTIIGTDVLLFQNREYFKN